MDLPADNVGDFRPPGVIVNNTTVEAIRDISYDAADAAFNAGVVAFTVDPGGPIRAAR
ncbi:hypothetical protein [Mycobacterium sp. URHB0021]